MTLVGKSNVTYFLTTRTCQGPVVGGCSATGYPTLDPQCLVLPSFSLLYSNDIQGVCCCTGLTFRVFVVVQ